MADLIDRIRYRLRMLKLAFTLPRFAGGDGEDGDGNGDKGDDGADDGAGSGDGGKDEGGDAGGASGSGEPDWKAEARKHERRAKQERKRAEALERAQQERDQESQTEHEKAIAEAEEKGRTAAQAEATKERRRDRLEVAATRLASRGIDVGSGDDAKSVKFADPEDALAAISRRIDNGELDPDELFDDENRVQTDVLVTELSDVLAKRPHLAANGKPPAGDPDTRKGGTADQDLEAMTPEDHLKRIQKTAT